MRMRSFAGLAVSVVLGCSGSPAGPTGPASAVLRDEVAAANRAHQPLVAEFGATWCTPCGWFTARVLPDPRVQAALHDVMFVQYDVDTPAGSDAARRYGIHTLPAVISIGRDGAVRLTKLGELTAEDFVAFLSQAKAMLAASAR